MPHFVSKTSLSCSHNTFNYTMDTPPLLPTSSISSFYFASLHLPHFSKSLWHLSFSVVILLLWALLSKSQLQWCPNWFPSFRALLRWNPSDAEEWPSTSHACTAVLVPTIQSPKSPVHLLLYSSCPRPSILHDCHVSCSCPRFYVVLQTKPSWITVAPCLWNFPHLKYSFVPSPVKILPLSQPPLQILLPSAPSL